MGWYFDEYPYHDVVSTDPILQTDRQISLPLISFAISGKRGLYSALAPPKGEAAENQREDFSPLAPPKCGLNIVAVRKTDIAKENLSWAQICAEQLTEEVVG